MLSLAELDVDSKDDDFNLSKKCLSSIRSLLSWYDFSYSLDDLTGVNWYKTGCSSSLCFWLCLELSFDPSYLWCVLLFSLNDEEVDEYVAPSSGNAVERDFGGCYFTSFELLTSIDASSSIDLHLIFYENLSLTSYFF